MTRSSLTICTWNVNSIRLRCDLLKMLTAAQHPDVLCLQETKAPDDVFPREAFFALGYDHLLIKGMKGYNGVAIAARQPLTLIDAPDWCGKGDCRHLAARIATPQGPTEIHNFYVPAGGPIADRATNLKFAHKLDFVTAMHAWFREARQKRDRIILCGDLNIAPGEHDVWSHKHMQKIVSHTPIEVAHLETLRQGLNWTDAARHFVPSDQKLYSWWSYRAKDWRSSGRGLRLDHIWVTEPLKPALVRVTHLTDARGWPRASDHVPVSATLQM
ncbi:MAG: exodeoxyribonuclease III [Alphaproteobacteria bacterium]